MKGKDTLNFALRFFSIRQKRDLKKIADKNNNSINQEVNAAINDHILNNSVVRPKQSIIRGESNGDL